MYSIIHFGIKGIEESELILSFLVIAIIFVIIGFSMPHVNLSYLGNFDAAKFFIPYGVVLFAFLGMPAIPEIREELEGQEEDMKKAIILGTLVPIIIYLVFAFVVVGVVGYENFASLSANQRVATIALGRQLGQYMVIFGNIFSSFAMATSFIALAFALTEMYKYDYKLNKHLATILTFGVPFIIALSGITNFIQIIGFAGVIVGGFNGVLIVLMFWKAKKMGHRKPEYTIENSKMIGYILMALFILGAAIELLKHFIY